MCALPAKLAPASQEDKKHTVIEVCGAPSARFLACKGHNDVRLL